MFRCLETVPVTFWHFLVPTIPVLRSTSVCILYRYSYKSLVWLRVHITNVVDPDPH
jgi:hypothetical protein